MAILNAAYSGNSPTGLVSSPIGIPVERTFEENGIRSRYRGQIIHNPVACEEGAFPEPPQIVYDESDFDDDSDEDTPFSSLSPISLSDVDFLEVPLVVARGSELCWKVRYGDGDTEDLNATEIIAAIALTAAPPQAQLHEIDTASLRTSSAKSRRKRSSQNAAHTSSKNPKKKQKRKKGVRILQREAHKRAYRDATSTVADPTLPPLHPIWNGSWFTFNKEGRPAKKPHAFYEDLKAGKTATCRKSWIASKVGSWGLFLIFCVHGFIYGFNDILVAEGRKDAYYILRYIMPHKPKVARIGRFPHTRNTCERTYAHTHPLKTHTGPPTCVRTITSHFLRLSVYNHTRT